MFKARKPRPVSSRKRRATTAAKLPGFAASVCGSLQWWDERNVVSPRQDGHKRIYLPEEVVEISVIAELRRKGFSAAEDPRAFLRFLQKDMGKRLNDALSAASDVHLLTDGKSIFLEEAPNRIIDVLKNARQPMFLVCVDGPGETLDGGRRAQAGQVRKPPPPRARFAPSDLLRNLSVPPTPCGRLPRGRRTAPTPLRRTSMGCTGPVGRPPGRTHPAEFPATRER